VTHVETDVPALWREYRERPTVELRNRLVEMYLPLVKYNAERIWARLPDGVELDDLISAGVFGLMDAIDAFDLTRGVKFETYCVPRIRGAMLDELRTMDWVPRLVRSKASKMEEARKSLEAALGRPPFVLEVLTSVDPRRLPTLAALGPYWRPARGADSYDIGIAALLDGLVGRATGLPPR